MFFGRSSELKELSNLSQLKKASLIVLRGRRRIGKSQLLKHFGTKDHGFIDISGLAPTAKISNAVQLKNFSEQLSIVTGFAGLSFSNWKDAFSTLAKITEKRKVFILLGEISWIDENILKNTDFVGRVSWEKNLKELPLEDAIRFWGKSNTSAKDKLKILSITGGVPKYLEEVNSATSAEQNIEALCFTSTGYLSNDFSKIYLEMLNSLVDRKLQLKDIASETYLEQNGDLSHYINDMEEAGFLARDYNWDLSGKAGKLSQIRIKDNYLRFYLKYIRGHEDKISKDI